MSVRKVHDNITSSLNRQIAESKRVPSKAHTFWKSITPKRSGNARRKTTLRGNAIFCRYKYATQLDEGASSQAPNGMSGPTSDYITKLMKHILRK